MYSTQVKDRIMLACFVGMTLGSIFFNCGILEETNTNDDPSLKASDKNENVSFFKFLDTLLGNSSMNDFQIQEGWLGQIWIDQPLARFFPKENIDTLKVDLWKATYEQSNNYNFVKCEARQIPGLKPESRKADDCSYLIKKSNGVRIEFFFFSYNAESRRECPNGLSEAGCKIHQGIRLRSIYDGIERPAVFAARTPITGPTKIHMRKDIAYPDAETVWVTEPYNPKSHLIAMSSKWLQEFDQLRRQRARNWVMFGLALVFPVLTIPQIAAAIGGTTLGSIAVGMDVLAAASYIAETSTDAMELKNFIQRLPQNSPARQTLSCYIMFGDLSTYLAFASLSVNISAWIFSSQMAAANAMTLEDLSKATGYKIQDMPPTELEKVANANGQIHKALADKITAQQLKVDGWKVKWEKALNDRKAILDKIRARPATVGSNEDLWNMSDYGNEIGDIYVNQKEILHEMQMKILGY